MAILPLIERRMNGSLQLAGLTRNLDILADQLTALAGLQGGRAVLTAPFDLRALAQDALTLYAPALTATRVQAAVFGPSGVTVSGHRAAALQALLHLVENAVIAASNQLHERNVTITVAADPATLIVQDCGTGVLPEIREQIFDPYYTTREGRNGMGLYLARTLLRASGGHDLALSADGCAFEIHFSCH